MNKYDRHELTKNNRLLTWDIHIQKATGFNMIVSVQSSMKRETVVLQYSLRKNCKSRLQLA